MQCLGRLVLGLVLGPALGLAIFLPSSAIPRPVQPEPPGDRIIDLGKVFDANEVEMFVTNQGSWACNIPAGGPGLEWPRTSGNTLVYAGGLWLGARVNGEVRVTVGEFSQEFAAGPLDANGVPLDPNESSPVHRVYKINLGDGPSNPDWANWPVQFGAPTNPDGTPRVIGQQTMWCVYNDAVPGKHTNNAGNSPPLGVEVRQTAYGFTLPGAVYKNVFLDFEIENKGPNLLEEMYISFWYDPDLGDYRDDLVGCDTTLSLGYCYNATNVDSIYGFHPPAVGCKLLLGPIVNGDTLGMFSFNKYVNGTDPSSPLETYNYMRGLDLTGAPQLCNGFPTRFVLSGDPVAGTGCLDFVPSDRRFMVTTGPITMHHGDVQRLVVAVIAGGKFGEGDRLSNVTLLKSYARALQGSFDGGFDNIYPDCDPGGPYLGNAGEPIQLDGSGSFDPDGTIVSYEWDFGDGLSATEPMPAHVYAVGGLYRVILIVTDDRGAPSANGTTAEVYGATGVGHFTDVTPFGPQSAAYLNLNATNRRALTGVDWGGRVFSGGIDTGCRWSGSTFTESPEDSATFCPRAVVEADRFRTVELRFGAPNAGKGYLYYRRELADGSQPPLGRQYAYGGFADIPFTAHDSLTGAQLAVMFTERQVVDMNNVPLPPGQQPETYNGTWGPSAAAEGGREYINVLDVPYSSTPDPQFQQSGLFLSGTIPVLYGFWTRLRAVGDVIDPGDKLVVYWIDLGAIGDGVEATWVDFDRDRDRHPDLHLARSTGPDRLFRYDGAGGFADVTRGPIADPGPATGAGWGDYDNDRDLDVYVANAAGGNHLLRNDGGGVFADVTSGPLGGAGVSAAVAWADADLDGDLDLYLANTDVANKLLRNDGGGIFADATTGPLGGVPGAGRGAAWADFDGDLDSDLYLANAGADRLLRNDGGGVFDELAGPFGDALTGADVDWGDYDGDGDLDVYIVNADGPNRVLRNDGGGAFADATSGPLGDPGAGRAGSFGDFDNDGDLDLYVVNADGPNKVLQNEGNGVFTDLESPIADPGVGLDAAWADHDGDGDLDLCLTNEGETRVFRNDIQYTRWIEVDLVGRTSNATGVGARLLVVAGGRSQIREVSASSGNSLTAEFGLGGATDVDLLEVRWPSGIVQRLIGLPSYYRIEVTEPEPSPVALSRFEAAGEVGRVVLTWATSHERDLLGFHVWRSADEGAGYARLTAEPVAGESPYRFADTAVEAGRTYFYRLEALDRGGGSELFGPVRGTPLARPLVLALRQNVPNPFAPSKAMTAIGFELPAAGDVRLAVYDVAGRCVRRLVDGRREAGAYEVLWDGRSDGGRMVGAGVYVCRLEAGVARLARKMLLMP